MASSSHRWTYDVFVSFRGEDLRKCFIDHLFSAFCLKGIHAFKDDRQLSRGEDISSQLYKAIEESRFLLIIFSRNYASSTWCLRELVKILKCKEMETGKYEVRTIFYDVKPTVVRNQTGHYEEAFQKHEASNNKEVPKWKEALTKSADLSGWDLQDVANGYESKFIDTISRDIFQKLSDGPLHVGENLVGIHYRTEKMNLLRFVGSSDVHMIGISGIGGIGKTTIARAIYNLLYVHFEGYSFCEDVKGFVKKHGMVQLQKQLIEDITNAKGLKIRSVGEGSCVMKQRMVAKQVLIVLDNIDNLCQLEALAGSRGWFGPGSLIILTGRNRQVLHVHGVEEIHDVGYLYNDEALELFSWYAFKTEHPQEEFIGLTDLVVQYVRGHPLALKVLGSFLHGKTLHEWEDVLGRLQRFPDADAEIHQVLRLSYDELDRKKKRIFLDIACFFNGQKKDFLAKIHDGRDLFTDTNIRVLVDRSLVTVSSNMSLHMHDLLRQVGWEIVIQASQSPDNWNRLWISLPVPNDVSVVLLKAEEAGVAEDQLLDVEGQKVQKLATRFDRPVYNLGLLPRSFSPKDSKSNLRDER